MAEDGGRLKPRLGGLRATKPAVAGWVRAILIARGNMVFQERSRCSKRCRSRLDLVRDGGLRGPQALQARF